MRRKAIVFITILSLLTCLFTTGVSADTLDQAEKAEIIDEIIVLNEGFYMVPEQPAVKEEVIEITKEDLQKAQENSGGKGTNIQYPVTVKRTFHYNYYSYTGNVIDQATVTLTGLYMGYGNGDFTDVQVSFSGVNAALLSSSSTFSGNSAVVNVYLSGIHIAQYQYTMTSGEIY